MSESEQCATERRIRRMWRSSHTLKSIARHQPPSTVTTGDIVNHGLAYVEKRGKTPGDALYNRVGENFALAGHSLGGGAVTAGTRRWPERVKVGVVQHSAARQKERPRDGANQPPLIFFAGSSDTTTSAARMKSGQFGTAKEPSILAVLRGSGHSEPMDFGGRQRHVRRIPSQISVSDAPVPALLVTRRYSTIDTLTFTPPPRTVPRTLHLTRSRIHTSSQFSDCICTMRLRPRKSFGARARAVSRRMGGIPRS